MKLATARTALGQRAVRIHPDGTAYALDAPDVGALLANPDWCELAARTEGQELDASGLDLAPLVPHPRKIICVGLNYRAHVAEVGAEMPEFPTLFAKYATALIGPRDDILLPPESRQVDWEAELAVVIGQPVRRADERQAAAAIAGYTVLNDISMRDWQNRTGQWTQGKAFEASTPLGPLLVTTDEFDPAGHRISCSVDGELMQDGDLSDLVFDPITIVRYISTFTTLEPGDLIATGTPGGVGLSRSPQRFLQPGSRVVTSIDGLGSLENVCRPE